MSDLISIKIDVTKIQKERLFAGKNGAKYLDAILIPSPNSQYGDSHFIAQAVTKEERLAGQKGPIIGNAKTLGGRNTPAPSQPSKPAQSQGEIDEDVPF